MINLLIALRIDQLPTYLDKDGRLTVFTGNLSRLHNRICRGRCRFYAYHFLSNFFNLPTHSLRGEIHIYQAPGHDDDYANHSDGKIDKGPTRTLLIDAKHPLYGGPAHGGLS